MNAEQREQVRRDARTRKIVHVLCNCECRHAQTGHEAMRELDALLAELEQAERERDEALNVARAMYAEVAAVPALVEAGDQMHKHLRATGYVQQEWVDARTAYEQAQEQR